MTSGRLRSADTSDRNLNDFGGDDALNVGRLQVGHFERRDEGDAAGVALDAGRPVRAVGMFAETTGPQDEVGHAEFVQVADNFVRADRSTVQIGRARIGMTTGRNVPATTQTAVRIGI